MIMQRHKRFHARSKDAKGKCLKSRSTCAADSLVGLQNERTTPEIPNQTAKTVQDYIGHRSCLSQSEHLGFDNHRMPRIPSYDSNYITTPRIVEAGSCVSLRDREMSHNASRLTYASTNLVHTGTSLINFNPPAPPAVNLNSVTVKLLNLQQQIRELQSAGWLQKHNIMTNAFLACIDEELSLASVPVEPVHATNFSDTVSRNDNSSISFWNRATEHMARIGQTTNTPPIRRTGSHDGSGSNPNDQRDYRVSGYGQTEMISVSRGAAIYHERQEQEKQSDRHSSHQSSLNASDNDDADSDNIKSSSSADSTSRRRTSSRLKGFGGRKVTLDELRKSSRHLNKTEVQNNQSAFNKEYLNGSAMSLQEKSKATTGDVTIKTVELGKKAHIKKREDCSKNDNTGQRKNLVVTKAIKSVTARKRRGFAIKPLILKKARNDLLTNTAGEDGDKIDSNDVKAGSNHMRNNTRQKVTPGIYNDVNGMSNKTVVDEGYRISRIKRLVPIINYVKNVPVTKAITASLPAANTVRLTTQCVVALTPVIATSQASTESEAVVPLPHKTSHNSSGKAISMKEQSSNITKKDVRENARERVIAAVSTIKGGDKLRSGSVSPTKGSMASDDTVSNRPRLKTVAEVSQPIATRPEKGPTTETPTVVINLVEDVNQSPYPVLLRNMFINTLTEKFDFQWLQMICWKEQVFRCQCVFCPKSDTRMKMIAEHLCKEHGNFLFALEPYQKPLNVTETSMLFLNCRHCDFVTVDENIMYLHYYIYHRISALMEFRDKIDLSPVYDFDGIPIDDVATLVVVYMCIECNAISDNSHKLSMHVIHDHAHTASYNPCFVKLKKLSSAPECVDEYESTAEVRQHTYRELAESAKLTACRSEVYICMLCDYFTLEPYASIKHSFAMHQVKRLLRVCSRCDYNSWTDTDMTRHLHVAHDSTDCVLICSTTIVEKSVEAYIECPAIEYRSHCEYPILNNMKIDNDDDDFLLQTVSQSQNGLTETTRGNDQRIRRGNVTIQIIQQKNGSDLFPEEPCDDGTDFDSSMLLEGFSIADVCSPFESNEHAQALSSEISQSNRLTEPYEGSEGSGGEVEGSSDGGDPSATMESSEEKDVERDYNEVMKSTGRKVVGKSVTILRNNNELSSAELQSIEVTSSLTRLHQGKKHS